MSGFSEAQRAALRAIPAGVRAGSRDATSMTSWWSASPPDTLANLACAQSPALTCGVALPGRKTIRPTARW